MSASLSSVPHGEKRTTVIYGCPGIVISDIHRKVSPSETFHTNRSRAPNLRSSLLALDVVPAKRWRGLLAAVFVPKELLFSF